MNRGKHVLPSVPVPVPFGAHMVDKGVQFSLFSRHAKRVWLMLFKTPDATVPDAEFELTPERNRIGDIWHLHVPNARAGQYYLYRLEGGDTGPDLQFYDPEQWILDPYALAVTGPAKWGDRNGYIPGKPMKKGPTFPKGIILRDDFDWSEDHTLRIPLDKTIIYEAHVRGYTAHESARVRAPGTYRGLIEKIPYLKELGITAIELLPLQEFNEMEYFLENMTRKTLRNFWGYSTLAFFAPNGRFAANNQHGEQVREFKEMVLALHKAGIEVILDVVFNHTVEGGPRGQTYSFRGIDNSIYYMVDEPTGNYKNYTGCGNTVNSNHPVVRNFIMHCLRYWTLHMRVDGFRFDLASVLTRDSDGNVLPNPPIVEQIAEDPALRDVKIIAEAWDAAGAYQVGSFPSDRWSEWNGKFRDEVRCAWRGDGGMLGKLATRLAGSADLYHRDGQTPLKSVNYITCHDGFTLNDLVSYSKKHNLANGEDNRDGDNNNHSHNYGKEGPAPNPKINAIRLRQQKNMLATLFLAQGVPMLLAGDEFSRTQHGNNNAYCQDNEISWLDWSLLKRNRPLHEFVKQLIIFRKAHPALRRAAFFRGEQAGGNNPDILWLGPNNQAPDWENGSALACLLDGQKENIGAAHDDDNLLLIFNLGLAPAFFHLPAADGKPWRLAWSTQEQPPELVKGQIQVDARSVTVLAAPRR